MIRLAVLGLARMHELLECHRRFPCNHANYANELFQPLLRLFVPTRFPPTTTVNREIRSTRLLFPTAPPPPLHNRTLGNTGNYRSPRVQWGTGIESEEI